MADDAQLAILRKDTDFWNQWRANALSARHDLSEADQALLRQAGRGRANLSEADLGGADLSGANLNQTHLTGANLSGTDLRRADLKKADLSEADFRGANLSGADLAGADLTGANLNGTDLTNTNLVDATLSGVQGLSNATLNNADFGGATGLDGTEFGRADVTGVILPEGIGGFKILQVVEERSRNARKLLLSVLLGCAYAWLTLASTTDAQLLTNSASSPTADHRYRCSDGTFLLGRTGPPPGPVLLPAFLFDLALGRPGEPAGQVSRWQST